MRIGAFQFSSCEDTELNFAAIKRAIVEAAENKVKLLVFHECALCGYPPLETDISKIDFDKLDICIAEIRQMAKQYNMHIALGNIREKHNEVLVIDSKGEIIGRYAKRALWGWDLDNFVKGENQGIYEIDGVKIGFRICYEVRFPEYLRELFKEKVELCFVCFNDTSQEDSIDRYDTIKAHLLTRAVENVMTVVSVNSISNYQTAPTAVFDINGKIVSEAPKNEEYLLIYDYETPEIGFGARGRIAHSLDLM